MILLLPGFKTTLSSLSEAILKQSGLYQSSAAIAGMVKATRHATAITPLVGSVVATTGTALPNVVEIWYGNTTTAVTTLAKQTAAKLYTIDVGVTETIHLIFKIDPTACAPYDCIGGTIANSGQATNFASAVWLIEPRYSSKVGSRTVTEYIVD